MASQMEKPAVGSRAAPVVSLAADGKIDPEFNLEALRKQYLAEIFGVDGSTAAVIAELAFGEASHA